MPPNIENRDVRYFGESRGHLHVILLSPELFLFDILELEKDYSGWSLMFCLYLNPMQDPFRGMNLYSEDDMIPLFDVLGIVREEKEEDSMLVLHIPDKALLLYNLVGGLNEFLPIMESHAPSPCLGSTYASFEYIESLSWVGGFTA
ncbi:F-box protein [Spatholobus suberectus]|nr:F-box protein [Spatholobus suberectus]